MMRPALMVSSVDEVKWTWRPVTGLMDRTAVHRPVAETSACVFHKADELSVALVATFKCKSPASYKTSPWLRW